ncbi:uncharacterized protein B0H64DRAFT_478697 [Chaetomium fimeti]|uniref:Uncharacterized protein n=1 Tax=Chaetomium fimeti TaxID=1854472 RepID=A0AAE0H6F8_9PEZI|nr:hypothetical protein B0H64DRAFT_478697 [Chaetomium fimeti]
MPPKSKYQKSEEAVGNADGPLSVLTAREQTMMLQGLLTVPGFPGGFQIDYAKVADRMGLKNPRSVANAWSLIKNKINAYDAKYREDNNLPTAAEEAAAQADDGDDNPSPKKRARGSKATTTAASNKPAARGKAAKPTVWPKHSIMGPLSDPLATAGDSDEAGSGAQEEEEEMGSSEEKNAGPEPGEV